MAQGSFSSWKRFLKKMIFLKLLHRSPGNRRALRVSQIDTDGHFAQRELVWGGKQVCGYREKCPLELTLLNCGVGEDSWESLGLQGDPTVHSEGDQSWVFIGRTETELQYFGHLIWRVYSLEKSLMLGGIGSRRRRGRQRMRWLDGITVSMDVSLSEL